MIDRITAWEPGRSGSAVKNVSLSEDFFADHFPRNPIMPGVLLIEGMAQLSGLVLEEGVRQDGGRKVKAFMSIVEKAKFRRPVRPGDSIEYTAEVLSQNDVGGRVMVRAAVDGVQVAECRLVFVFQEFDDPELEEVRSRLLSMWMADS